MSNLKLEGDLSGGNKQAQEKKEQGPLSKAVDFVGDLTVNRDRNKSINQFESYLAGNDGRLPSGSLVRYVGSNQNISSQAWAKAAEDTFNFNRYGAGSGISFSNDGKITIKATDTIKNSDWYKEKFAENGTFRQIAKLYGADPTGNTGIKIQDKNGDIKDTTVKDWLESEAEAFDEYVKQYSTAIVPTRESIKEASEGRIELSDEDSRIALSGINKEKYRYSNDVAVYLPAVALRFGLNKLPSYNEETNTISAKDFYDWYQVRFKGDEYAESAEEKVEDLEELQIALSSSVARILNSEEITDIDKNNLARDIALLNTLSHDRPETDGIVKVALFGKSFTTTVINDLATAGYNLTSFVESMNSKIADITSLNNNVGKVLAVATLGQSTALGSVAALNVTETEALKAGATNIGEFLAGVDGNPEEAKSINAFYALGDIYTGVLSGNGEEKIKEWAEATNTPLNRDAIAAVNEYYAQGQMSRESISGWAKGGRVVGNFVAEIVKQMLFTNVVGGLAGKAATSVVSTLAEDATAEALTAFSKSMLTMESGLQLYVGAQGTSALTLGFVKAVELAAKSAGFASNIMAQAFADTILNDEETVDRLLNNPNEEERHAFYEAYKYNVDCNLFGEVTGVGLGAAGKGLALGLRKTGVSALATRTMSFLGAKKHTILAEFSDWMAEGNSRAARALDKILKASDSTSRWWSNLHWQEAKALFEIADAGKGKTWAEATEATQKAVINRMEMELAMNNVTRGTMRQWRRIVGNDAIARQYKAVNDAYSDLLKSEGNNARKIGEIKSVSQETSDYIALSSRLDQILAKQAQLEANGKTLAKNEEAYKEGIQKRITDYEKSHSAEHIELAKNYLNKFRAYEFAYMNFAAKNLSEGGLGLYDSETVEGWRGTKYWGENGEQYIPLVRIKDADDMVGAASRSVDDWSKGGNYKAKISVDEYELKPGDVDAHYLDPQMAIYAQQVTAAKVYNAREWGNVLAANDTMAKEIDVNGKPVTKSEIRTSRANIRNIAEKTLDAYSKEGDILNFSIRESYKSRNKISLKRAKSDLRNALGSLDYNDMKALANAGVDIPYIPNPRTRAQLDSFMDSLTKKERKIVEECLNGNPLTIKNFNSAKANTDMAVRLQRSMLANNPDILKSPAYAKYIDDTVAAGKNADNAIAVLGSYKSLSNIEYQNALKEIGLDDFNVIVDDVLNDLLTSSDKSLADNKFLDQMLDRYSELGVSKDVAKKYLVLQEYKKLFSSKAGADKMASLLKRNLENISVAGNLSTATKNRIISDFQDLFKSHLESEWAKASSDLEAAGGKEMLDTEDIYNYIYEQMSDFIDTTLKQPNVVQMLDGEGKFHLYQLSPTTANLYTTRPDFSGGRKGIWGFFNKTNRLARLNNVGWSVKSFLNQWVKDPLNAFIMGGFSHSIKTNANEIGEMLGQDVVERVIREIGEEGWGKVVADAKESVGRSLTVDELTALARRQLPEGSGVISMAEEAVGKEGAETKYYREMGGGFREEMWGKFKEKQSLAERALSWAEEHSLGNRREVYLRKGVYMNAYRDALDMGRTSKEAATIAEFTSQNATTNFSRQFAFGNNIVSSVPFFGAALNGRASFWRLMEVDPVGISTRFTAGLVLPMLSLVTQSMEATSDKEIYKTFAEYEKEDNLCFVVDGEKVKIPLPEELTMFLNPFRHIVEKANDANDHSWAELVANDLLGTSAIDLTGFVGLDQNTLEGDPTLADRLSWEGQALISQLSPTIVKTAYMGITGIDPYTGDAINKEQVWTDEDGNSQIVDTKSNAALTWLSNKLNEMGIEVSGSTMHALFQTLVGNAGTDIFDTLANVFSGNYEDALDVLPNQIASPFVSKTSKDPGHYKFKEAVKSLEKEKDDLLNGNGRKGKEFINIANQISMLDPADKDYDKKLQQLNRKRKEIIQDYQQKVFNIVSNYQKEYGGEYDRKMFTSTINLLTFYRNYSSGLQIHEHESNKESYYAARSEALQTMATYGFSSPNDNSIFGYIRTNEYGEAVAKANSPTAIMNLSNEVWSQDDVDRANIEVKLKSLEIDRSHMFGDEYKAAKAAGKAAYKKYKSDWNKKVVEALAPYIESRGLDSVINNYETQDLMDNYLFDVNQYNRKEYLKKIFGEG